MSALSERLREASRADITLGVGLMREAADALDASDQRIADLERELTITQNQLRLVHSMPRIRTDLEAEVAHLRACNEVMRKPMRRLRAVAGLPAAGEAEVVDAVLLQLKNREAEVVRLRTAAQKLVGYRRRVGPLGWQLEKADDYIGALEVALGGQL